MFIATDVGSVGVHARHHAALHPLVALQDRLARSGLLLVLRRARLLLLSDGLPSREFRAKFEIQMIQCRVRFTMNIRG